MIDNRLYEKAKKSYVFCLEIEILKNIWLVFFFIFSLKMIDIYDFNIVDASQLQKIVFFSFIDYLPTILLCCFIMLISFLSLCYLFFIVLNNDYEKKRNLSLNIFSNVLSFIILLTFAFHVFRNFNFYCTNIKVMSITIIGLIIHILQFIKIISTRKKTKKLTQNIEIIKNI